MFILMLILGGGEEPLHPTVTHSDLPSEKKPKNRAYNHCNLQGEWTQQFLAAYCIVVVQLSFEHLKFPLASTWVCSLWVILHSHRPSSGLAIMKTIWKEWTPARRSLELVLRLLASHNKDQPPPPLITSRTFWSEWSWSRWRSKYPMNPCYSHSFHSY